MTLHDQKFPLFFRGDLPQGRHSRRHQTRDAQDAARELYQHNRGRQARVRRAEERALLASVETESRTSRRRRRRKGKNR